jgi:hypothetical protein
MCCGTFSTEEKVSNRKTYRYVFFLFQVFDLRFFTKIIISQVSGSESVSKSELFFGFGSGQNLRILSD